MRSEKPAGGGGGGGRVGCRSDRIGASVTGKRWQAECAVRESSVKMKKCGCVMCAEEWVVEEGRNSGQWPGVTAVLPLSRGRGVLGLIVAAVSRHRSAGTALVASSTIGGSSADNLTLRGACFQLRSTDRLTQPRPAVPRSSAQLSAAQWRHHAQPLLLAVRVATLDTARAAIATAATSADPQSCIARWRQLLQPRAAALRARERRTGRRRRRLLQ